MPPYYLVASERLPMIDRCGESEKIEAVITNMSRNYTGVSATIRALVPIQVPLCRLVLYGEPLPDCPDPIDKPTLMKIVKAARGGSGPIIWHARRNSEMALGLWLKRVRRLPIKLVFTSASRRRHSAIPRWLIGQMDAVIATTEGARSHLTESVGVISHGVDVQRFAPSADRAKEWQERGLPGRYGIGVFGRIRPAKGTDIFVDAMCALLQRHPDHTAVIVGSCKAKHEAWREQLVERAEKAGLADRIVWTGEVPIDDVPVWYRSMSICVTPARYEEFGLTPLEASASGAAAVATRTGAFEEIIIDGETGSLVPTDDVDALVAALDPLMDAPEIAVSMGNAGRERAVAHYDITKEAEAIVSVYRNLAASNHR